MLKTTFVDKGIPVIIGEYGCTTKNKQAKYINLYLSSVCKEAYSRGMLPVLWDVTDVFYDRTTCTFKDKDLLDGLMAAKEKETYNKVIPLYKMTPGAKYSGSLFIWLFTPSFQMTCSLCKPSEWGLPRVCRSGYDRVSSNLHSSSDAYSLL